MPRFVADNQDVALAVGLCFCCSTNTLGTSHGGVRVVRVVLAEDLSGVASVS